MKSTLYCFCVFAILCFENCKRKGCTDSEALNFEKKAKRDDRSCKYPFKEPPNYPFQGPLNPSFEKGDYVSFYYTPSNWVGGVQISSSTKPSGIMPSSGINFLKLQLNDYSSYQDSVDFSRSNKLFFDCEVFTSANMTVTLTFDVQNSGTITLWKRVFTFDTTMSNVTVPLPNLPNKGKLTINVDPLQIGEQDLFVDNFRVE